MPTPADSVANSITPPGRPAPPGATVVDAGVNFSLFAPDAVSVEICLFAEPLAPRPSREISLDPHRNRTGPHWHALVPEAGPGTVYGYRVRRELPDPVAGPACDGNKLLLDPYARAVVGQEIYDREAACQPGDNTPRALRAVVVPDDEYDWEGDTPLPPPAGRPLCYELHVRGFTAQAPDVDSEQRGTYAGLVAKIPYLQALGVTTVELLPVLQFDHQDTPAGLDNYWGYSPVAFLAPHAAYSSDRDPLGPRREFRAMVKALHRAGIRVVLDVVFNHTAEGGSDGPTLGFRGLANREYYIVDETEEGYVDHTGCGHTFAAGGAPGRRLILDALRSWVRDYHVDGFRFDLASVLTRDRRGQPDPETPLIWSVDFDPDLVTAELIAEPWDLGGLYQVGSFPGRRFRQWNDRYRDDVRRFLAGEEGTVEALMARIVGSPDLFSAPEHSPWRGVNLVTCHDGFTLNDLVSYNRKHNEANGEANLDGRDHNFSWNSGLEGPTSAPEIEATRARQVRNFLCLLILAQGQPLLTMGDEIRRTQRGNNNAYCQDNETSWFDWTAVERHGDLLRFTRELIRFSRSIHLLGMDRFWTVTGDNGPGELSWHGTKPGRPDWRPQSHSLAFTLDHVESEQSLCVLMNGYWRPLKFTLVKPVFGRRWRRIVDTALEPPADFTAPDEAPEVPATELRLAEHSVVVLLGGQAG